MPVASLLSVIHVETYLTLHLRVNITILTLCGSLHAIIVLRLQQEHCEASVFCFQPVVQALVGRRPVEEHLIDDQRRQHPAEQLQGNMELSQGNTL